MVGKDMGASGSWLCFQANSQHLGLSPGQGVCFSGSAYLTIWGTVMTQASCSNDWWGSLLSIPWYTQAFIPFPLNCEFDCFHRNIKLFSLDIPLFSCIACQMQFTPLPFEQGPTQH